MAGLKFRDIESGELVAAKENTDVLTDVLQLKTDIASLEGTTQDTIPRVLEAQEAVLELYEQLTTAEETIASLQQANVDLQAELASKDVQIQETQDAILEIYQIIQPLEEGSP